MSNQPFQVPKPNITASQINRPGPGGRLPGPLAGARPGMPKPGIPNPMGFKQPTPPNLTAPTQQTQPNVPKEEQKTQVEPVQPEIKKTEPVPEKIQPEKTVKAQVPPQMNRNPVTNPPLKTGPTFQPPTQITKQPVFEDEPKRVPPKQELPRKENVSEQPSDQFMRLSESLQAMKNLRSNFQGFAENQEGNEEEYEQNQGEGEYEDDDDYVKVEENEGLEEQEDVLGDESQQYEHYEQQEEEQEEREEIDNENYEGHEEQQYEEEEEVYEQKEEPQYTPAEIHEPVVTGKPVFHHHHHHLHPHQSQGSAGLKGTGVETQQPVVRETPVTQSQSKRGSLNPYPREVVQTEPVEEPREENIAQYQETRQQAVDQELLLKYERLQLELEGERRKNAHLEEEQGRLVQENTGLKQKNLELTARIESLNRRVEQGDSQSQQELEILKDEFNRSINETRQIYENANQQIQEAAQYREETESLINRLAEEKNGLHNQVLQLRREIDDDYRQKIESFKQKTELLEMRIQEYESNFLLVQQQLTDKSQTLLRVASLNSEIQTALSQISSTGGSAQPTIPRQTIQNVVPKTTIESRPRVEQKTLDLPRSQAESQWQKEEQKSVASSRKESASVKAPEEIQQKPLQTTQQTQGLTSQLNQETSLPPVQGTNQQAFPPTTLPQQNQGGRPLQPAPQTGPTSQDNNLTTPPAYKIPNKGKKDEVPKKAGFKPLPGNTLFGAEETQAPEEKNVSPPPTNQVQETQAPVSKPGGFVPAKSKLQKMDAKGLFDEPQGGESFFYSSTNQPSPKPHQKPRYPEETHEEQQEAGGYEETQQEEEDVYHAQSHPVQSGFASKQGPFGTQSRTNLRYSQNLPVEKEQSGISAEAAENFFDQLGQTSNQTSFPVQAQTQPQQTQGKPVHQTPVQRGKNPFAEESQEETSQSTDFFSNTTQHDSFVNRPEVQRAAQPRPVVGNVQTGMPKKIEPNKGSALKKMKGNIPSSMFD